MPHWDAVSLAYPTQSHYPEATPIRTRHVLAMLSTSFARLQLDSAGDQSFDFPHRSWMSYPLGYPSSAYDRVSVCLTTSCSATVNSQVFSTDDTVDCLKPKSHLAGLAKWIITEQRPLKSVNVHFLYI